MKTAVILLLRTVISNRAFVETLMAWCLKKLLMIATKKLSKLEAEGGPKTDEKVADMVKTMNRIQETMTLAQTVFNTMIEQSAYEGDKVEKVESTKNVQGVKGTTTVRGRILTSNDIINIGMKTLNSWSKKRPTPEDYTNNKGAFIK